MLQEMLPLSILVPYLLRERGGVGRIEEKEGGSERERNRFLSLSLVLGVGRSEFYLF